MKAWRMILSGVGDGFFNMALDEALLISCQRDASPPVVRLYQWNPAAVSLGYFQPVSKTVASADGKA
jgi:lipoate-protein ligase A